MNHSDLVRSLYSLFSSGNVPAALALFDPAIEWYESTGMPFVKGDGHFTGPDAVLTNVFMQLPVYYDGFKINIQDVFGEGEKVAVVGYYEGVNRATGNPFRANIAHIWTLKNGKLARLFHVADTAATLR